MRRQTTPDQTVQVTYDPTRPTPWTFDPESVSMAASGLIILTKFPASQSWSFTGDFTVTGKAGGPNPQPGEFTRDSGHSNPNQLAIRDGFRTKGTFCYTVMISTDGSSITSPDPQIINEGP